MKKTQLIAFFVGLGIAKANAEKLAANTPDDLADVPQTDIDSTLTAFKAHQTDLFKNDADFIKQFTSAEAGRQMTIFETKLRKATGLTPDEVKDKKMDEIIALAVDKLRKKGDVTAEELQKENVRLAAELKKITEEDIPAIKGQVDSQKKAINIETHLEKLVSANKLRVSPTAALATIKTLLGAKYEFDFNDKGELDVFTKEGRLKPKNADGTKLLTLTELLTDTLKTEKLIEESGGGPTPPPKKDPTGTIVTSDEKKAALYERYPHLKKAEENKDVVKNDIAENKKS